MMMNIQVSDNVQLAYIEAIERASDETAQIHANKLMAEYALGEITAAQVIAHLNYIG
jgi:hypothetical protein|tara:strand:+ start:572 stop:742 length:171 start_codon:yes stop_codon:yes gene_type:complete